MVTPNATAAAPGPISYASGTAAKPLLGETIDANLRRAVAAYPDREAVVDVPTGERLTYRELDAGVEDVARGLFARGVQRGDRVGIWAPNCLPWFLVQYATARIGAILVNINPAYRTHELEYVLRQDRKSTRLNSSHPSISYAVFCLKKKNMWQCMRFLSGFSYA